MQYKEFCYNLAKEAGQVMLRYFAVDNGMQWKSDNTPVTQADLEINSLVIKRINKAFPDHDILGEEESHIINNSEFLWVCDPIDGTIPYSHGIPTSVFSLALVQDGEPIAAIIYEPWLNTIYYAEKGQRAWKNEKLIQVNENNSLNQSLISMEAPSKIWNYYKVLEELDQLGAKTVRNRSFIYPSRLIASGEFTGGIFGKNSSHDAASLDILIREAGGKTSDINGNEQRFDQPINGFIASNGLVHDKLLNIISRTN